MEWDEIAEARMGEIRRLRSVIRDFSNMLDRKNDMLFQVIQHSREETQRSFSDWKDADDWLFAKFDITTEELDEVYKNRGVMVYGGSCVGGERHSEQEADGQSASPSAPSM